jgi:YesN/AraC family two-component response regulator
MASLLELEGYHVDTAKTGAEAVEKSKSNFYNLALIDIRLPDMEGTKLLTAMPNTVPKMAKIILTGYPTLNSAIEAVNTGADGYVTKPITDLDNFLQKIREHLRKQEESEQYAEEKIADFLKTRLEHLETKESKVSNSTKSRENEEDRTGYDWSRF